MSEYIFNHDWQAELERLQMVEQIYDANTIAHLEAAGVGAGWRCLEVGGGAGSIAAWMAERVGPTGHVVATDLQTDFLEKLSPPGVEIRPHNIVTDDLEADSYDLIHARMVLQHVPERDEALRRMVAALAPSGVLVEEDLECVGLVAGPHPKADFFDRYQRVLLGLMPGYDPHFGRRLPVALRALGLTDVAAAGWMPFALCDTVATEMWQLIVERMREPLVAGGHLTAREVDELVALHDDEGFSFLYPAMVTARGRRTAASDVR
jgi:SAM-dependent methyltransferase